MEASTVEHERRWLSTSRSLSFVSHVCWIIVLLCFFLVKMTLLPKHANFFFQVEKKSAISLVFLLPPQKKKRADSHVAPLRRNFSLWKFQFQNELKNSVQTQSTLCTVWSSFRVCHFRFALNYHSLFKFYGWSTRKNGWRWMKPFNWIQLLSLFW